MSAPRPGRLALIGVFLLGMAAFYALVALGADVFPRIVTYHVSVIAPVFGATLAGMLWRRRSVRMPGWRDRRPVSCAMAFVLVTLYLLASAALGVFLLDTDQTTLRDAWREFVQVIGIYLRGEMRLSLLSGLIALCVISLIQTELGLFLGVWFQDKIMQRSAERT